MPATDGPDPDHHLWRNGRLWWIAFTLIHEGWRQQRVRRSLGTDDLVEARRRRDEMLFAYAASRDPVLSLRVAPASRRRTATFTARVAA
jgi:hypothetical protein